MKKLICFLFLFYSLTSAYGQIFDDFSDRELHNNPTWSGDTNNFIVNSAQQLQLSASGAGISYISTYTADFSFPKQWLFNIKMSFSPSDNNYCCFYLSSDKANLTDSTLNGLYLRFGENGNNDAIKLFEQKGNNHRLLGNGISAYIASAFDIWVKIIVDDNIWSIYTAPNTTDTLFVEQFKCTFNTITAPNIGIKCVYTSSNANKFFFDNIYYGSILSDTTPPVVVKYEFNNNDKSILSLFFNENIDTSTINIAHFEASPNIGKPQNIVFYNNNLSKIDLIFNEQFAENQICTLNIKHIKDLSGNSLADTNISIVNYRSTPFEILITEIMSKPSPMVGLPDAEYIELYNSKDYPINLKNYQLNVGNSSKTFPDYTLQAHEYLIITANSSIPLLASFGNILGFSSLQITNDGQEISIFNTDTTLIHNVYFSSQWHSNNTKANGGWSLEMIDTQNPCGEAENWKSSIADMGGTPGAINSVFQSNPDTKLPNIDHIFTNTDSIVSIYFDEKILPSTLLKLSNYQFDHKIAAQRIISIGKDWKSVSLLVYPYLKANTIYTLSITDTISDCVGNMIPLKTYSSFGLAQKAQGNEIIINEILFNPQNDGVDFVEIYNNSDKIIDLSSLSLSSRQNNGTIGAIKPITSIAKSIFPQQYLLLSTNSAIVMSQYICSYPEALLEVPALPALPNTSGNIILLCDTNIIDEFTYDESMHYSMLKSFDGVSLERIRFNAPTQSADNWHSAAATAGFATPGYKNSVYLDDEVLKDSITLIPDIFSPDMDGFDDVLTINYLFSANGYRISIDIYTINGQMIRRLVNNETVGTEGFFTWDGTIDNHSKAPVGQYILLIKLWDLNGNIKKFKKSCTLAIKF